MKRFEDYTKQELLSLTELEVNEVIALECMIEGIQIAPPAGPKPVFETKAQPVTLFQIGNTDRFFSTMEDALTVAAVPSYDREGYRSLNDIYVATKRKDKAVQAVQMYIDTDLEDQVVAKAEYERKLSAWESRKNTYYSYTNKRDKISQDIYRAINEAVAEFGEQKERTDAYATYLKLAEGDSTIADRFFINMLIKQDWDEANADEELARIRAEAVGVPK